MVLLFIAAIVSLYQNANTFPMESKKLSGSFSEFRGNHLHTGIDISTDGIEGYPVLAPADGYISYIKQDYLGYGKALFLSNNEYIFVFGHLQGFSSSITEILDKKRYKQVLYPNINTIKVHEGDTIAYAGRTGTYVPHLHFEMRSMANHPVNPYDYFHIPDDKSPELMHIVIEPADDTTLINGRHEVAIIKGYRYSDRYYNFSPVNIRGTYRIYPIIIDRQLSQTARLFIHSLDIFSTSNHIYHFAIDSVSFDFSSRSPLLFRSDLDFNDRNYIFNPHASLPWLVNKNMRILYSNIDTIIILSAMDFSGNRTIATLKVNSDSILSSGPDDIKIHKVNDKLVVSFPSGEWSKNNTYGFDMYNAGYLYYIFNTKNHLKGPTYINGTFIHYDFLCIGPDNPHKPNTNIQVESNEIMYCIFDTKQPHIDGLSTVSDIMDYQLCNRYTASPFRYIISGYNGYSLYMKSGEKFRFMRHLSDLDTLYSHYLQPLLIARDIEKPQAVLINRKGNILQYRLKDEVSGINWHFVGDSNSIYNIPDPQKGVVELHLKYSYDSLFIIKDREGNADTLILR